MITYFNTSIIAIVGLVTIFLGSLWFDIKNKQKVTVFKISIAGMLLALTIILNVISGYIPVIRLIRFEFGLISVFIAGLLIGPSMTFLLVIAEDNLTFLIQSPGSYHPGFAFGTELVGLSANLISSYCAKSESKLRVSLAIVIAYFISYSFLTFVINPILLVAIGWVPQLGWAIYVPRLIKWIPEIVFYVSIIISIYWFAGGKKVHHKIHDLSHTWA